MILSHPDLENVIELTTDAVPSIVIENKKFFYRLLRELVFQINGEDGKFCLYDEGKVLELSHYIDLTDSFLNFTINKKPLQNKIISYIESIGTEGENYLKTIKLLTEIESYIDNLSVDLPCNIEYEKITLNSILKAVGICIQENYENPLEEILDYMELVREFDKNKIFIFVNMRSYFSSEELTLFFKSVISHEFRILLIDGFSDTLMQYEKRLTIDDDLCEF